MPHGQLRAMKEDFVEGEDLLSFCQTKRNVFLHLFHFLSTIEQTYKFYFKRKSKKRKSRLYSTL